MSHLQSKNSVGAMELNRRRWLQWGGTAVASALGVGSLSALRQGRAQAVSGYKALVCVFLYGGNDGMNMVVPNDLTRHQQYAAVRGPLALPRSSLVGLGSTGYGLHPSMSALAPVWASGGLAPVFNLGPLVGPLSKVQFLAAAPQALPESLFSHSDQQIQWEASSPFSISRTGWGGRAASTMAMSNPVISVGGNGHFGLSEMEAPLVVPGPGSGFGLEGLDDLSWAPVAARKAALDALYRQDFSNLTRDAFATSMTDAVQVGQRLGGLVAAMPADVSAALRTAFLPITNAEGRITTDFGRQLFQVAKLIEGRGTVQGAQQIFFAQMGGFDTHSTQISTSSLAGDHARLMQVLADGMACFYNAMTAIGMGDSVTLFTQSEFGRTFAPNSSSGTDHAWGNHQLVMGGAVNGGATYGDYPELVLGGSSDMGVEEWERQGCWIPRLGVDQYAATLLRWLGSSEAQLDTILPNLANFGSARNIGFL
ncbi:MAG: DUF1501 domain-containing protein [Hydrogenophaga sp.]